MKGYAQRSHMVPIFWVQKKQSFHFSLWFTYPQHFSNTHQTSQPQFWYRMKTARLDFVLWYRCGLYGWCLSHGVRLELNIWTHAWNLLALCFLLYKVDTFKVAQDFGARSKGARRVPWPNFNRESESQFEIKFAKFDEPFGIGWRNFSFDVPWQMHDLISNCNSSLRLKFGQGARRAPFERAPKSCATLNMPTL